MSFCGGMGQRPQGKVLCLLSPLQQRLPTTHRTRLHHRLQRPGALARPQARAHHTLPATALRQVPAFTLRQSYRTLPASAWPQAAALPPRQAHRLPPAQAFSPLLASGESRRHTHPLFHLAPPHHMRRVGALLPLQATLQAHPFMHPLRMLPQALRMALQHRMRPVEVLVRRQARALPMPRVAATTLHRALRMPRPPHQPPCPVPILQ